MSQQIDQEVECFVSYLAQLLNFKKTIAKEKIKPGLKWKKDKASKGQPQASYRMLFCNTYWLSPSCLPGQSLVLGICLSKFFLQSTHQRHQTYYVLSKLQCCKFYTNRGPGQRGLYEWLHAMMLPCTF